MNKSALLCLLLAGLASAVERHSVDSALGGRDFLDGRELAITGRLFLGPENQILRGRTDRIWIDFFGRHGSDREARRAVLEASRPLREQAETLIGQCVTITATFRIGRRGHLGVFPAELVDIQSIEAADPFHCIGISHNRRK
jgi:hypothetical protein